MNRLASLSCTFRDANATTRMALVDVDDASDSPTEALKERGLVSGIVRVETCSRVEWIVSSSSSKWSLDLLEAAFRKRTPIQAGQLRRHFGAGAALHVFRTCLGLDSLVEAEGAVGKQVTRAFQQAHADKQVDEVLRSLWKHVDGVRHQAREAGLLRNNFGVQSLVKRALEERGLTNRVLILGRGEIGRAVASALGPGAQTFGRDGLSSFLAQAVNADALVICTGGHAPWIDLPAHRGVLIDVGFPPQVRSASGWQQLTLDELLSNDSIELKAGDRHQLEELCIGGADEMVQHLQASAQRKAMGALDAERQSFFEEEWPRLTKDLKPAQADFLKQEFSAFTHRLMKRIGERP